MKVEPIQIEETIKSAIDLKPNGTQKDPSTGFRLYPNLKFFLAGIFFGIMLLKSEAISWFRIQEMFRLQSFYMFGVLGTAIATGMLSIQIIKKFKIKTIQKEPIVLRPKKFHKGIVYGGLLFGFGWALTGACPGPLFTQIGSGATVVLVTLLSAVGGTWTYGLIRDRLPH
jgi:uncharacterized protein